MVWNSSGYESPETLAAARGLVDVYLPDFKYAKASTGAELADAPDYFEVALAAIQEMCAQTGAPVYDVDGMLRRGTLVRHLVLPLRVDETVVILQTIARALPPGTPVSLMRQYTPMNGVAAKGLERLTAREYARARDALFALGLDGYLQEKEAATSAYTPAFMDEESTQLFDGLPQIKNGGLGHSTRAADPCRLRARCIISIPSRALWGRERFCSVTRRGGENITVPRKAFITMPEG